MSSSGSGGCGGRRGMQALQFFLGFAEHEFEGEFAAEIGARHGGDEATVAQDREVVGDGFDLAHAVGDEDNRAALATQRADHVEQALDVGSAQRRSGLVEDEDARVERHGFGDLDELGFGQRQRAEHGAGLDRVDAETGEQASGFADRGLLVNPADAVAALAADQDVLGDGEAGEEREFLVHCGDAGGEGGTGRSQARRRAVQQDAAFVGLDVAGQDFDERAFASAVGAEQRVDRTFVKSERDAGQGRDAAVALGERVGGEDGMQTGHFTTSATGMFTPHLAMSRLVTKLPGCLGK